jgi:NTE family protein
LRRRGALNTVRGMGNPNVAVILAGAVAKGAFEAGALDVLGGRNVNIVRIVGASSGALNATVLASGVHAGDVPAATSKLARLWQDEASLTHVFHFNPRDVLSLRGLSDQTKLLQLLERNVEPRPAGNPIELRIVASPLGGTPSAIGGDSATTYERVFSFDDRDFQSAAALQRVFLAATASASFPGAFAPFDPGGGGVGPCVDGGLVNNTPIKYAVEGSGIETVVVIAPTVQVVPPGTMVNLTGTNLVGHIADMLINERLYRDMREAEAVTDGLKKLAQLGLPAGAVESVKAAIGWTGRRALEIVTIRPLDPLPGNAFSGFVSSDVRKQTIALGRERALAALGGRWR